MWDREYDKDLKKAAYFIQELEERGLLHSSTNKGALASLLAAGRRTYMGIDPTADFLHLGHYVGLSILKRFARNGYPVVLVLGSFTAKIGDPSFRSTSRKFNPNIDSNAEKIKRQLLRLFQDEANMHNYRDPRVPLFELVDNYTFHNSRFTRNLTIRDRPVNLLLEFMDEVCSKLKVSELLKRQFLADRLGNGLTLSEFLYTGLQGWDFLHLHKEKQVSIQIGGSDQWGNMLTGLELIYKSLIQDENDDSMNSVDFSKAGVMTFPIISDSHGNKFGKSEGNAISIDDSAVERNIYSISQYFLNIPDDAVYQYFLQFTHLHVDEIIHIMNLGYKEAKLKLSECICEDIFGNEATKGVSMVARDVFYGGTGTTYYELLHRFRQGILPHQEAHWQEDIYLSSVFEYIGLISSKSEFNRLVSSRGIYVMNVPQEELERRNYMLKEEYVVWEDERKRAGILMVRKGKKQYGLIHFIRKNETLDRYDNRPHWLERRKYAFD